MTKQELRKIFLEKRLSLSQKAFMQLNHQLCRNFFDNIDLSGIHNLHIFISIDKNREPNTWLIIEKLQKDFPRIRVLVPKVNNETGELESYVFEGQQQLQKNIWGIPEPEHGLPVEPQEIDMVLVPLLAFDKSGHRVGYGKGFYDKFLIRCKPGTKKIGISLFEAVDAISDVNPSDVVLDRCVTPEGVYPFLQDGFK